MDSRAHILSLTRTKGRVRVSFLARQMRVSRQYASRLVSELVKSGQLIKLGSTRNASYILPEKSQQFAHLMPDRVEKVLINRGLAEDVVWREIAQKLKLSDHLPSNVFSILEYSFTEMLNNAIEHSKSPKINLTVWKDNREIGFVVRDFGIGVFRNVARQRKLKSELDGIQEILKGKTTTARSAHSGEGIFFTSKAGDRFEINSFGYQLIVDRPSRDIIIGEADPVLKGSRVEFRLSLKSKRTLKQLFSGYTNPDTFAFDKTEIVVRLYVLGGDYVARSQARRILTGLNKFQRIVLDFTDIKAVGQAFVDEIFRVFKKKHPKIRLDVVNANKAVKFMINRVGK